MKRWACICRLGGIGDNLIAASVLKPLKKLGYMVEVITSETAQCVYLNNPYIDKLSVKKEGEIPSGQDWHKWFATRSGEYDLLVNLSNSVETRHALFQGMTAFWWPVEYRRKLCAGSYLETACDIVGVPYDWCPLFYPTEEERERAQKTKQEVGGRFLTWAISGSRIDKIYPYAAMAIARIIRECSMPVVMMGSGGAQFTHAKQIQEHVKRQNGDDVGLHLALSPDSAEPGGAQSWPVRRSLTLACAADVVVTPDTGVGWAVAMEPMPKIALMSHASAENITKNWINTVTLHADADRVPCWPCHRLHDAIETCVPNKDGGHAAACMSDITVEDIVRSVQRAHGAVTPKVLPFPSHAA